MKKILTLLSALTLTLFFAVSCYDDSELRERMENAEQRLEALEELCNTLNSNILSLQSIVDAMQDGITILNVEETENGYIIYFSDGSKIQIDTSFEQPVPQIGVKEYEGKYYWTVDGEWLTDSEGNKILAKASVPELKIEDDTWYVSYDNGQSWTPLGNSTGDSFFEEIKEDEDYVYFILKDGTTITIAKSKEGPALYLRLNTEGLIEMSAGETMDIGYEIITSEDDANVTLETFEQYGWSVVINPNPESSDSGTVSITAPSPIRDGKILFILSDDKGNFYAKTVEIKGKGNIIDIVKDSYIVDEKGGLLDVSVNSNIEFTVNIPDEAVSWIETVFAGETTRFSIKSNDSYDERTATITFVGNDGETKKEISITQLQTNAILLTSSVFDISAEEQSVSLVFTANVNVNVEIPDDVSWISFAPTKAMSERTVELLVMANDSPEKRTAVVTLTDENSSVSEAVTINQAGYQADYIVFEDRLFKEVLVELYDTNEDAEIDSREASAITNIECSGKSIYSLKGIEKLTNLQTLDCSNNSITELDLTANTELTSVKCYSNSLVDLNIGGLEKLTYLDCRSNSLTEINTSFNPELLYYNCSLNNIKTLDVSKNTKLESLYCYSCRLLTTLNIENLANLTALYLSMSENSIAQKNVNVSGSSLQSLLMGGNARWLNVAISGNPNLKSLSLDGIATMTKLTCTSNPQLAEMLLADCYALKELYCGANILSALDLSTSRALTNLDCSDNNLQTLDLSSNVALLSLDCSNNSLSSLSVNNSLSIDHIDCSANALSVIDVTSLSELSYIDCSGNEIKSLDLSNNVKLVTLDCSANPLSNLDVSNNKTVKSVNCSTTNITSLDLTANTSLSEIFCKDCYNLAGVVFPETLAAIQQEAFKNCTSLASLSFPALITSIGQDAFNNCSTLSELNITSDVIGPNFYNNAFTGAPITTVNMNENVTVIGESAFVGAKLNSVIIPASVTQIERYAFEGQPLISVSFAQNSKLQAIIDCAFRFCENLKSFDASNCADIRTIDGAAFDECQIDEFKIGTMAPPSLLFSRYDPDITNLYVPTGCVEVYKNSVWAQFCTNILEL